MKKVGFFGGTFDPIHFGHISLAIRLMEQHQLDEVLFCPAFCSPFKLDTPPLATPEDRLSLLKLALEIPKFKITTLELERKSPSYTIDTLRLLKNPKIEYRLLLSEEAARHFESWKNIEELIQIAPPLIGPREFPISSTQIRARLKDKLYCGHLVPSKALQYILSNFLYTPSS